MKRLHLFEFEDQRWYPSLFRSFITDILQHQLARFNVYKPVIPKLKKLMAETHTTEIIDLCSGGGGPLLRLRSELEAQGVDAKITMSDRYPNTAAFERIQKLSGGAVGYCPEPVDATEVSTTQKGIRTLFSSFHHFRPDTARAILKNAADNRAAIGVFEFTERKVSNFIKMVLLSPILVLLQTPLIRPFKLSRLVFTYLIPIAPLIHIWDATVSHMRTYTPKELEQMVSGLGGADYRWEIAQDKTGGRANITITSLIGYPENSQPNE